MARVCTNRINANLPLFLARLNTLAKRTLREHIGLRSDNREQKARPTVRLHTRLAHPPHAKRRNKQKTKL